MVTLTPIDSIPSQPEPANNGVTLTPLSADPLPEAPWHSFATGSGRTEFPDAPEFGTKDISNDRGAFSSDALKVFGAYLSTGNEKEISNVIKDVLPDAKVGRDRYNKVMVKWRGRDYYINKPGFSEVDAMQLVGDVVQFAPAAKAVAKMTGWGRYAATALGFGGTQAAREGATAALGGDPSAEEAAMRVGTTAVTAPLFDAGFKVVGSALRNGYRVAMNGRGTKTAQSVFKQAGLDPADFPDQFARDLQDEISKLPLSVQRALREGGNKAQAKIDDEAQRIVRAALAKARTRTTGIPKTAAQETGDMSMWRNEQRMREGGFGGGPQQTMREFDAAQNAAIKSRVDDLRETVTGNSARIEREADAGGLLQDTLSSSRQRMEDAVDTAYDAARASYEKKIGQPGFSKGDINELSGRIPKLLDEKNITITKETSLLRNAQKIIDEYSVGQDIETGSKLSLAAIEKMRARVGGLIGQARNSSERRGLTLIKNEIDDWVAARADIPEMEAARAARTAMGEAFEPRGRRGEKVLDAARKAAGDISLGDTKSSQAALNKVLGSNGLSNSSVTLINHLKKTFPDTLPIMKEAAVMRAVYGNADRSAKGIGVQQMVSNLDMAVDGRGVEAMRALFSKDELGVMKLLRDDLRSIVPPPGVRNPSGTAAAVRDIISGYAARFPFMAATLAGFGETTAAAVAIGAKAAQAARQSMPGPAAQAVKGFRPPLPANPLVGPAATAGGPLAGEYGFDIYDRLQGQN